MEKERHSVNSIMYDLRKLQNYCRHVCIDILSHILMKDNYLCNGNKKTL